ncbi:MAG: GNAT family N-acetyltransferase [Eubacteriales bacterium]|nr:GNAT family N-acetyltransferase [Eubacteriales bacterium]
MNFTKIFELRQVRPEEADEVAEIEQICFPPNEACSVSQMKARVQAAPEVFLVAVDRETGRIAGFLNGLATDEEAFRDEFFRDAGMHKKDGKNIMLLGLDVRPEYRGRGLAREIVLQYQKREKEKNRKTLILTCLDSKVSMYQKMGFTDLGMADSSWGGEKWHEMSCVLNEQ